MKVNKLSMIVCVAAMCMLTGCMTAKRGFMEPVLVNSVPSGAKVSVTKDEIVHGECLSTPCKILLRRNSPPFVVTFTKDGCESKNMVLGKDAVSLYNKFWGGFGIGYLTDFISGATFDITPNPLTVDLSCQ